MVAGAGDPHSSPNVFVHGDSPATGAAWCGGGGGGASSEGGSSSNIVTFDKLKLTNNRSSLVAGQVNKCYHKSHLISNIFKFLNFDKRASIYRSISRKKNCF